MAPPADGGGIVQIIGLNAIERKLDELTRLAPRQIGLALFEEAQAIMRIAKRKTPVDTGRLRASGYVGPPTLGPDGVMRIDLGFGTDYAVFVHERTELRHVTGEAKFLEKAVMERAPGFVARIIARTRRAIEQGRGYGSPSSGG